MRVFHSPAYTLSAHAFDTTRKPAWVADSLRDAPLPGAVLEAPEPVGRDALLRVHDAAYVDAVRTGEPRALAETQGFPWNPGLWGMVCASTGGVLAAARAALREGVAGSLSSGLHHARADRGAGFCTFNGLALAALGSGARAVLVLDLDAHCGGGTHSILRGGGVRQLDVSTSAFDRYRAEGADTLDLVDSAGDYLMIVEKRLRALDGVAFDLCLYNAGMDPYEGCDLGGLSGVDARMLAARERMVFRWARGRGLPVAFVLAGGYVGERLSRETLVGLHRLTLEAALEVGPVPAAHGDARIA